MSALSNAATPTVVSVTRFRARSIWVLPSFLLQAQRAIRQLEAADGMMGWALHRETALIYATMTQWRDVNAMLVYVHGGAHAAAMPGLARWAAEARVVRWEQQAETLPAWPEAMRRLDIDGRNLTIRPAARRGDQNRM